nr:FecR family protein [uncultured Sphingobacterium sp.]
MNQKLNEAVDRLLSGNINKDELEQILNAVDHPDEQDQLKEYIGQKIDEQLPHHAENRIDPLFLNRLDDRVLVIPRIKKMQSRPRRLVYRKWVAALIICCGLSYVVYQLDVWHKIWPGDRQDITAIAAATPQSRLTWGDDRVVSLNALKLGDSVPFQGGLIRRAEAGVLTYERVSNRSEQVEMPVSISTGIGDSFKIVLPDGTKAWLNAQSTLVFASNFGEKSRTVKSAGEVYFEVTPAALANNQPFSVQTDKQTITVLGTAFNVKSYPSQPIVTSLITGKVKLDLAGRMVVLKPGDQAVFDQKNHKIDVQDFDQATVIDWKSGYFIFKDTPIKDVIAKLSNWYGFQVKELPKLSDDMLINAKIRRDIDVNSVLKSIEKIAACSFYIDADKVLRQRY